MMLFAVFSLAVVPVPFSAIEARCSGGVAGRTQIARLTPDGRMMRSTSFRDALKSAGRITPDQAKALSQRLDRAFFDTMPSLPRVRTVYDGVSCMLKREGKVWHAVQFVAGAAAPPRNAVERYGEVRSVMSDLLQADDRATPDPESLPPLQR